MATLLDQWRLLRAMLRDKRLSKGDCVVGAALLDFATDTGGAWPAIDKLAGRADVSRRAAIYSAGRLVEAGYFTCARGGGRKNTTVYRPIYLVETVQSVAPFQAGNSATGCTLSTAETVQQSAPFQAETVQSSVRKQCKPLHPNLPMNPPKKKKIDSADLDFADWWSEYPHKTAKPKAMTQYRKAHAKVGAPVLLDGLRAYKRDKPTWQAWAGPAAWLAAERWTDQPAPQPDSRASRATADNGIFTLIDEGRI